MAFLLPRYQAEGKPALLLAMGCTGGKHRSVVMAEQLTARLRDLTDDPEEYLRLLRAETPASLGFTWEQYAWVLHGCGLALYETAPGNE